MNKKWNFVGLLLLVCTFIQAQKNENEWKLWYNQPATRWVEALPLGNGRLGAMVFGDPSREEFQLNEETIWEDHHTTIRIQKPKRLCQKYVNLYLKERIKKPKNCVDQPFVRNQLTECLIKQ